jgi:hypothetical protein
VCVCAAAGALALERYVPPHLGRIPRAEPSSVHEQREFEPAPVEV